MQTAAANRPLTATWQRWFVLGLCLLFLALGVQYSVKALGNSDRSNRSAFLRWHDQLQHLDSEDIYRQYNFPYPPIMAMLLEPLMRLPPLAGSLCWFFMKLGMTAVALRWIFRLVETSEQPFPPWAKALTVLLSLRPIMGDLSHGNVNLFILLLVVASVYSFQQRRDLLAGLGLALGISCKVTPALFVPYFLWKRSWKTLAGCGAGLLLFLLVVPGLRFGFERNLTLLRHWTDNMVAPFVVQGAVTSDHLNQSLPGLAFRMLTHSPSSHDPLGLNPEFDNIMNLEPRLAGWLLKGCMLVFAGLVVCSCRTPMQLRQGWRLAAEFALVAVGMLIFSERTWKHHCVTLMLPLAVLTYYLAVCRPMPMLRNYLAGSLLAVVLLISSTSMPGWALFDDMARKAEVYGAYVWAYFVLVGALVTILLTRDSPHFQRAASQTAGGWSTAESAQRRNPLPIAPRTPGIFLPGPGPTG